MVITLCISGNVFLPLLVTHGFSLLLSFLFNILLTGCG